MKLKLPDARVDWSSSERSDLRRLHSAYPPPLYEMECGLIEDGDPWCIVRDCVRDRITVHIAHIGRRYVVAHSEKKISRTVAQIKTAIDLATGGI
jgi:hypothetical protein